MGAQPVHAEHSAAEIKPAQPSPSILESRNLYPAPSISESLFAIQNLTSEPPKPPYFSQAITLGTHRGTFQQYSSYSAPNNLRRFGSSYSCTNAMTPKITIATMPIPAQFHHPNTTHNPSHPQKNPMYIGFRIYRQNPTTTNFFGGAIGDGVPWPICPKSHTQRNATANPSTDGTAAIHRHGSLRAARV